MGALGPTWYQGDALAPPGVLYHYTSGVALRAILASGVLKPHRTMPTDRLPLLWVSANAVWEPASGRGLVWNPAQPQSFDVLAQRAGGLARIAVEADAAPLSWPDLRKLISPQWLALLRGEAGSWVREHCHHWHGTTHPVSRERWCGIQVWRAPRWRDMPYSWEA